MDAAEDAGGGEEAEGPVGGVGGFAGVIDHIFGGAGGGGDGDDDAAFELAGEGEAGERDLFEAEAEGGDELGVGVLGLGGFEDEGVLFDGDAVAGGGLGDLIGESLRGRDGFEMGDGGEGAGVDGVGAEGEGLGWGDGLAGLAPAGCFSGAGGAAGVVHADAGLFGAAEDGGGGDGAPEWIGRGGGGLEEAGEGGGGFIQLVRAVGVEAFVPDGDEEGDAEDEQGKAFGTMGHAPVNS